MKSIVIVIALISLLPLTGCVDQILETKVVTNDPEPEETVEVIPKVNRKEILTKRAAVRGKVYTSLTISGTSYKSAVVTDIDDHGIKLQHKGGISVISWSDTAPKVRDAWGFDAAAHAQIVRDIESKRKQQESFGDAVAPTKEELAARSKVEKQEKEKADEEEFDRLSLRLVELNSDLRRGKNAIIRITESHKELKEEYEEQDQPDVAVNSDSGYETVKRSKGVRTSQRDRNKKLDSHTSQLNRARQAIAEIEKQIDIVNYELSKLR